MFNESLDKILEGIKMYGENELLDISQELMEIGEKGAKESRNRVYKKFNDKLDDKKKNSKYKFSPILKIAGSFLIVLISASLFFKSGLAEKTINGLMAKFSIEEIEVNSDDYREIPEVFLGKVYDELGEPIDIYRSGEKIYTKSGKVIYYLDEEKEDIITMNEGDKYIKKEEKEKGLIEEMYYNIEDIKKLANFNIYYPEYLPKGYRFKIALVNRHKDIEEILSIDLEFSKGKDLIIINQSRPKDANKKLDINRVKPENQEPVFIEEDEIVIDDILTKGRKNLESKYHSSSFTKEGTGIVINFPKDFTDQEEMMKVIDSLKLLE